MVVAITEFKKNIGKYLKLVSNEDIIITKRGKAIAQFTEPQVNKLKILNSLIGVANTGEEVINIKDLRIEEQ